MLFAKTKFNLFIINLLWLTGLSQADAQPYNWDVFDKEGNRKFSITADTIFPILKDLYCIQTGSESVVVKEDPLQLLIRVKNIRFQPLNRNFFCSQEANLVRMFSALNPGKPLPYQFRTVRTWKGAVIGETDLRCIYQPGTENEIQADSFRQEPTRILLFRPEGIAEIDTNNKARFYHAAGARRGINPYSSYILNDSLWQPASGSGNSLVWHPKGFWMNDTLYLDSNQTGVFRQSPSIRRHRLSDSLKTISPHFCALYKKGTVYILTSSGKTYKIPKAYLFCSLNDSLCAYKTKSRWNIISSAGNRYPINKTISTLSQLHEGMMMVKAGNRYGYIDEMGFIRISCRYDSLQSFHHGLSAARLGPVWGFLDKNEKLSIQPHYQIVQSFYQPITAVKKDNKWGLISMKGDFIQNCIYDSISAATFSGWKITRNKWTGWLNYEGKILLPNRYTDIIEPCSGFLQVFRDGKTGLFTSNGSQLLPLHYAHIHTEHQTQSIFARK